MSEKDIKDIIISVIREVKEEEPILQKVGEDFITRDVEWAIEAIFKLMLHDIKNPFTFFQLMSENIGQLIEVLSDHNGSWMGLYDAINNRNEIICKKGGNEVYYVIIPNYLIPIIKEQMKESKLI